MEDLPELQEEDLSSLEKSPSLREQGLPSLEESPSLQEQGLPSVQELPSSEEHPSLQEQGLQTDEMCEHHEQEKVVDFLGWLVRSHEACNTQKTCVIQEALCLRQI